MRILLGNKLFYFQLSQRIKEVIVENFFQCFVFMFQDAFIRKTQKYADDFPHVSYNVTISRKIGLYFEKNVYYCYQWYGFPQYNSVNKLTKMGLN